MIAERLFQTDIIGDTLLVAPAGSIGSLADEGVLSELNELLESLEAGVVRNVVVDLENAPFFGSSLLEALRRLWLVARSSGGSLVITGASPTACEVLHAVRFDTLFPQYANRQAAIDALHRAA